MLLYVENVLKKNPLTEKNINETILTIDLKKLKHNFNFFKNKLNSNTKIIAVVKAFGYGHGDVKISKALEKMGVYAFWVADFEEGVVLRKSGLKSKIIVANPGLKSYEKIIKYNLDVVVYNNKLLNLYCKNKQAINIHIKFNTGMNRYGFNKEDVKRVITTIQKNKHITTISICSHLSCSEILKNNDFTKQQLLNFNLIAYEFNSYYKKPILKHILNSNGAIYFNKHQMDMVRIGIGLYGNAFEKKLLPISSLRSVIAQNRIISKGDYIGYGANYIAKKNMVISIVPVGYADGINRKLGNGVGKIAVKNIACPIVGEISMDSLAVDTTEIKTEEGDSVEIFGKNISVNEIAQSINTIPYEIYATLNRRLKRVYIY